MAARVVVGNKVLSPSIWDQRPAVAVGDCTARVGSGSRFGSICTVFEPF